MDDGPQLSIESDDRGAVAEKNGRWRMGWQVENRGSVPLQILATWLPHGRFRAERHNLTPPATLPPGEQLHLRFSVACSEPAGGVVENAFIILHVVWHAVAWRVFARLRISCDVAARPSSATELITAQRAESEA